MPLTEVNLYSDITPSYGTGAKDCGNGVGFKHLPSPLFATYRAPNPMPNGIGPSSSAYANLPGCWVHGSDIYFFYRDTGGSGKGVYKFNLNVSPEKITMSYDSMATMAALFGTSAKTPMPHAAATYITGGKVFLATYRGGGTGYGNLMGRWDMTNWPFTNGNADWISNVQLSHGSYVAGQITNYASTVVGSTYIYLSSAGSGQVHVLNYSNGTVAGNWVYYGAYAGTEAYWFELMGESGGQPCGGNVNATGSLGNLTQWNISNLNSWTQGTVLLDGSQYAAYQVSGHSFGRAHRNMASVYKYWEPISRYELDVLGLNATTLGWWSGHLWDDAQAPLSMLTFDTSTSEYLERKMFRSSYHDCGQSSIYEKIKEFVTIDGIPWFVCQSAFDQRMEDESPGADTSNNVGLRAFPIGPVEITYTLPSATGTPKKLALTMGASTDDFVFACHDSKHRFAVRKNGGGWSSWRSGRRQLMNLDAVVDGIAAWPTFVGTDTIEIKHQMCTGWPYTWGNAIGNAGESGAPTSPTIITSDMSPPRDVVPIFMYEGAGGVISTDRQGVRPIATDAYVIKPNVTECYVSTP